MFTESIERDQHYWSQLELLFKERGYSIENVLRNWPAYIMRRDLARFLSHYELFKLVADLPGSIAEIGVFRGASFFTWSNLLEIFSPFDRARLVYGFDTFEGLTLAIEDGAPDARVAKVEGGYSSSRADLELLTSLHNADTMVPGCNRCRLELGDVVETVPRFIAAHPGLRISLLHLDADLYHPTKVVLEAFWPLIVRGGVVVFDEYAFEPWEGETRAADEFFATLAQPPTLRKHPFTQTPTGYLIKP